MASAKIGFDLVFAQAAAEDYPTLLATVRRMLEILGILTSTVSVAYVKEYRAVVSEHHTRLAAAAHEAAFRGRVTGSARVRPAVKPGCRGLPSSLTG